MPATATCPFWFTLPRNEDIIYNRAMAHAASAMCSGRIFITQGNIKCIPVQRN